MTRETTFCDQNQLRPSTCSLIGSSMLLSEVSHKHHGTATSMEKPCKQASKRRRLDMCCKEREERYFPCCATHLSTTIVLAVNRIIMHQPWCNSSGISIERRSTESRGLTIAGPAAFACLKRQITFDRLYPQSRPLMSTHCPISRRECIVPVRGRTCDATCGHWCLESWLTDRCGVPT